MATYYWVGGNNGSYGYWDSFSGQNWSLASGKPITASCSSNLLTVTAGTVVVGDSIWSNDNTLLGTVLANAGPGQWQITGFFTLPSQAMTAATTGSSGVGYPTTADDVIFDANSGTANFTVSVGNFSGAPVASCKNFTVTMATAGRLTFSSINNGYIECYGTPTINAATTFDPTYPTTLTLEASSGAISVTTNNVRIPTLRFGYFVASTATFTLAGATTVNNFQVYSGTVNTNGQTLTATTQNFNASTCSVAIYGGTLSLGASVVNIGASASELNGSYANFDFVSGATFTAGTSVITIGSTSTVNQNFTQLLNIVPCTFATLVLNGVASWIFGPNTFATRLTKNAVTNQSFLQIYDTQTFNSGATLQLLGTASTRLLVMSDQAGTRRTFSGVATGTRTLSFVSFMDIEMSFGSPISGTSVGNMLNNNGINFDAARTLYLVLGTATKSFSDSSGSNPWSLNPIGIPVGASPPLPQDTVIFNANSGLGTLLLDTVYLGIINTTGFAGSAYPPTASTLYVMGQPTDPVGVIGNILSSPIVYRFDSNINLPSVPCNLLSNFYINGISATATLSANISVGAIYVLNGNLNTNSFNVNASFLTLFLSSAYLQQASSTSAKTLTFGSSYITLTSSVPFNFDTATLNAGTSTIEVITSSGSSATLGNINGKTLNNLKLTKTSIATDFTYSGLSGATFNNITVSPHTGLIKINLSSGSTTTLNSLTTNATKGNGIIIGPSLTTTTALTNSTLAIGSNIVTEYVAFLGITKSGASTLAPRGAADLGGNVGISFDPHVAVAFSGSGATSFTVPDNFTGSSYFLVLGAGGGAGKRSVGTAAAGGGGGGAVAVASNLNVSRGQTIYLNAPTGGAGATTSGAGGSPANAWVNIAANSQPTLATNGAYADSGNGSPGVASTSGGTGGSVSSSASLGQLLYPGGLGNSSGAGGGGGGSVGSLIFRIGRVGGVGGNNAGAGGGSIQNTGVSGGASTGGAGGAVSPNSGGAGGAGGASPQPGGAGAAGTSVGGGGGGSSNTAGVNSGAGGAGGTGGQWTYNRLNGVASSGLIGYGGAGGGGGGIASTLTANSIGGRGGDGANGSGGGGGGRGSATGGAAGNGGNGGDALVLFVYVESRGLTFGTIIG
jgi:hypothetical protein